MRLMQDEKPIEYHVINWRNSAFHNHDVPVKRKMFGGVSFDGGAISGNDKRESNITQTGVHEVQPSFSHMHEENALINAGVSGSGNYKGKAGAETETNTKTEALNAKESKVSNLNVLIGNNILDDIITNVINITGDNAATSGSTTDHGNEANASAIKSGRFPHMKSITFKLGQGIRTLLGKNTEDSRKQSRQKSKKKLTSGTRPVTKEDVYEIQVNSSYLLDSYNKNGERSTLGK